MVWIPWNFFFREETLREKSTENLENVCVTILIKNKIFISPVEHSGRVPEHDGMERP